MAKTSAAFPVGLYGMLLFALLWLTLPRLFAPLERVMVGAVCIVPRATSSMLGEPAMAASAEDLARIAALGRDLDSRIERHDFAGAAMSLPAGAQPLLCGVLSVSRRGGAGLPSELRLDHSYRELAGCRELVTKELALVGFLLRPGVGRAIDDELDDPARVILCHHRDAPRTFAGLDNEGGDLLRFVVRGAAAVDPAPLRVDIWDNPYRAAELKKPGQSVYTLPLSFGERRVPGGLLLGQTRIWGYEEPATGKQLTIGVYVDLPFDPRALSHVVLWRERAGEAIAPSPMRAFHRAAAVVYDLPGVARGRHLLVVEEPVPDGAAVVQDGLFLGTARGLAFGTGLVTSFAASRQEWSLLFLPDDADGSPVELRAPVVDSRENNVRLRLRRQDYEQLMTAGAGYLFTGCNGQFCPAGLWIGRAEIDRERHDHLIVRVPESRGPRIATVIVGEAVL